MIKEVNRQEMIKNKGCGHSNCVKNLQPRQGVRGLSIYICINYDIIDYNINFRNSLMLAETDNTEALRDRTTGITKYQKISTQLRLDLVQMVEEFDYSIYGAAKDLKIRPSTAKAIMKRYRETGTVFIKKNKLILQNISSSSENNNIINQQLVPNVVLVKKEEPQEIQNRRLDIEDNNNGAYITNPAVMPTYWYMFYYYI